MKIKNIRNIFILSVFFSLILLEAGLAADNREISLFQRGNVYYEQGNFDEAIRQYNGILEAGSESGNLYYNMGNCYFKKRELGRAVLNYEKARRLMPLDKDLESNYEYACSLIKGTEAAPKRSFPAMVLSGLFEKFTIDGLTVLLSAFYMIILVSIATGFFASALKKNIIILAVVTGFFFIAGFAALTGKTALLNKEAIVIAQQTDARFEPMNKATTHFTLYEGMKVDVISSEDNWSKVKHPDNKNGWVENSAIAVF